MRYVVTGAAGFIGSQLLRTLIERGHDAVGWDCVHRLLRPGAEGGERARPARRARRPRRGRARPLRRGRRLPSRRPARSQQLRRRVSDLRPPERARERASVRGGRERGRARGLRLVLVDLRRCRELPDTRGRACRVRSRRTGSRSSPASTSATRTDASSGSTHVVVRYFTIFGPRQRPDMALAKIVACLVDGRPFELHDDGTQSRSFTYVDDAVEATILAMERAHIGRCLQRRRRRRGDDARGDRDAVGGLRAGARARPRAAPRGRPEPDARGHEPDPREDSAGSRRTPFAEGLEAQWRWAADRVASR